MRRWFSSFWYPPPPETYDMILIINLHGLTSLTGNDTKTCEELPMPEGMRATFLDATPCGVVNLSYAGYWKKKAIQMVEAHLHPTDAEPTKAFAKECQSLFQTLKKKVLNQVDFSDITSEEEMLAFRRNDGWDIVECKEEYINKEYAEDKDPTNQLSEVLVLYSKNPDFRNTTLSPIDSRESLLHYLHKEGVKHPLIIDASCSNVIGSPTAARYAARELNSRKRQRIGGRKLTKRPKVKKLIHFS